MTESTPPAPTVDGRHATWLGGAFYVAAAIVALAGATAAAMRWLNWPWYFCLAVVGVVELGGITLAAIADFRVRLGERAYAVRTLSLGVAVGAVLIQWVGHPNRIQAGVFAGLSALAYLTYLVQSAARRRDQLRRDGKLADTPPQYPPAQRLRHPILTSRAQTIMQADPSLDLHSAYAAAVKAARDESRRATIAKLLRQRLVASKGKLGAKLAAAVYDLDQIAARLAAEADYDGLAAILGADLAPKRMLPGQQPAPRKPKQTDSSTPDTPTASAPDSPDTPVPRQPAKRGDSAPAKTPRAKDRKPWSEEAKRNAAHLREMYGDSLPTTRGGKVSGNQIRIKTGWHYGRVNTAVAAYEAGADRQADTPAPRQDDRQVDPDSDRAEATG